MRRAAAADRNQPEIVNALRLAGARVLPLHQVGQGCPDLLVGYRGALHLVEVKDGYKPPSRRLTPAQVDFHREWSGLPVHVVETVEQALEAIGVATR